MHIINQKPSIKTWEKKIHFCLIKNRQKNQFLIHRLRQETFHHSNKSGKYLASQIKWNKAITSIRNSKITNWDKQNITRILYKIIHTWSGPKTRQRCCPMETTYIWKASQTIRQARRARRDVVSMGQYLCPKLRHSHKRFSQK